MLTAQTKNGNKICLGYDFNKATLISLRKKEEFICPICGESVILKLGDQRVFHFAHKSGGNCREFYENETVYHMEGKRQLFQWLNRQKIPCILEYYDREIRQRPDILFTHHGKRYALEYQCSTLPEHVFIKRTETYLENDYIPLWIVSDSQMKQKRKNMVSLSNFVYLFLRSTSTGFFYIPFYCPEKRHFHFIDSITPLSVKNSFARQTFFPLDGVCVTDILEPKTNALPQLKYWNIELDKFLLNWLRHPSPKQKSILYEIYNHQLNIFLLPPEIGLPVSNALYIETPPLIWQTYLFLDILAAKRPGDFITLPEINKFLYKRTARKEIMIRHLPQLKKASPLSAVLGYLLLLEQLEIVTQKEENVFQLQRNIVIPASNREREEARITFYQKHMQILLQGAY